MTHRIALITDSTSDIPREWIEQYDITIVPLTIIFGERLYLDGIDLTAEQFYERLPGEAHHPTTSQPSPQVFLDTYRQAAARGAQEIVVVTISSAMSGTILSARQAAEEAAIPVCVIDSKSTAMGLGWQVIAAARAREAGGGLEAMQAAVEQARQNLAFYVTLDTIEYLSRGGRSMEAARLLDSFLRIKPLVYVRPDTGRVTPSVPARSRKGAIDGLYKEFFRHIDTSRPLHITVQHSGAPDEAQALADRVRREYSPKELFVAIASPVLGVHAGPCALALAGYAEKAGEDLYAS